MLAFGESEEQARLEAEKAFDNPPKPASLPGVINGADLLKAEFPEPVWLVEGLIPAGLTLLAGAPKRGKSWLALELAQGVCSDGYFLNHRVKSGKVLYCALEDSPRRLQSRLQKQGWTPGAAQNLTVLFGAQFHAHFGGKSGSANFLAFIKNEKFDLVIIDTVSRAFQIKDWNDSAAVTAVLSPLQEYTADTGTSIILIDHHRKRNGFDANPIEDILGSVSKSGVCDTIVGLYKEQGKPGARVSIVGRDVEEQELDIRFDAFTGCWVESAKSDDLTDTQRETLKAIEQLGGLATLSEITEATGRNRGTLFRELQKLLDKGYVIVEKRHWKIRSEATQATEAT
ncbi:MAG: AAA family ATPase [Anaerolineae bacterium]|nr:AAA family ATPase [Anaerolineae bacterium]